VIENTYRKYRIYLSTLVIHAQCLFADPGLLSQTAGCYYVLNHQKRCDQLTHKQSKLEIAVCAGAQPILADK